MFSFSAPSFTKGNLSSKTSWQGLIYPCCFSSNPTANTRVLYWLYCVESYAFIPFSNIGVIISFPSGFFFVITKKSIVLKLLGNVSVFSEGFHLNEYSHVFFFLGPASRNLLLPTPSNVGVNINPSVSYSYKFVLILVKI